MKITQHGDNLWKLTRFLVINSYFVREEDGLTLIDTGYTGGGDGILRAAAHLGLPIQRVTLTHAHGDHAGSLDELSVKLPETEFIFSQRTADFLRGQVSIEPGEPDEKIRGSFMIRSTQPDRLLMPGDHLGSLRVIPTPGHSPDHLSFYDERDGTLIAGDAYQTQGGIAVSGIRRWRFPMPAMATWHLPTALRSAQALLTFEPSRLATGHGPVLEDPLPDMGRAVREAEMKVHG